MGLFGPPNVVKMKIKKDVRGLVKALSYQRDKGVRQAAAEALGQIRDAWAVEPLIAALKDVDKDVRKAAANALGRLGDTRAVEPLIAAINDNEWEVHKAAADALRKMPD